MPKRFVYDAYYDHPIGMLPDGTINYVEADDPPFKPKVYNDLGRLLSDEELEELIHLGLNDEQTKINIDCKTLFSS